MSLTAPIFSDPLYSSSAKNSKTTGSKQDVSSMGKDEFMKLLLTQIKHQDPLNPLEDKDFVAQLATFSSLEQMTSMSNNIASFLKQQQLSNAATASSLIGQSISSLDNDSGVVKSVVVDDKGVYLTVNGKQVPFDRVKEIRNPYIV
ncbi:MAG: hypothetical protein EPN22_07510 [Nitrospirae bacterium]|nr:MAG: hypothetical protein EPN22_07510 [Nitrospirota bacterium]